MRQICQEHPERVIGGDTDHSIMEDEEGCDKKTDSGETTDSNL